MVKRDKADYRYDKKKSLSYKDSEAKRYNVETKLDEISDRSGVSLETLKTEFEEIINLDFIQFQSKLERKRYAIAQLRAKYIQGASIPKYQPSKAKGTPEYIAAQKKKREERMFSHRKTHPEMYDEQGNPIGYSVRAERVGVDQQKPEYPEFEEDPIEREITVTKHELRQEPKTDIGEKDTQTMHDPTIEKKKVRMSKKNMVWIEDENMALGGYYVRENVKRKPLVRTIGRGKNKREIPMKDVKRIPMAQPSIHPSGNFGGGGKLIKVFGGGPKSQILRKADFEDVDYLKRMGLTVTGAKTNPKVKDRWYSDSGDILNITEFPIEKKKTAQQRREPFTQKDANTGALRFLALGWGKNTMEFSMRDIPGVVDQVRKCAICQRPDWQFDYGDPSAFNRQKKTCSSCSERRIIKPRKQIRGGREVSIPFEFEWDYSTIGQMITPSRMNKRRKVRSNHVQMFLRKVFAVDETGKYPVGWW